ncbi:2-dehydro-3-deoxygalactonokinase [Cellvibrio fibrivorans]|uniref:2-dehydro-3-deoxygalactonokinase n=2 Tax=Cellvibrio fibrivorans TaxID=126350 RepID=A0ABU1UVN9_9GAMM|nr:2-dehydro-3-deoxygalactonokinase [Cellvibrio fibrivorans]
MGDMIAIDWGGTNFRLQVVNTLGDIVYSLTLPIGVNHSSRAELEQCLMNAIAQLPAQYVNVPIVMSGAVGSNVGLYETPYIECPVNPYQLAEQLINIQVGAVHAYIVPGVKTHVRTGLPDVMRGEETQVLGWMQQASKAELKEALLCLPGTHSKWVLLKRGKIVDFYTAFSGELFGNLCAQSLLVSGTQIHDEAAFVQGIKANTRDAFLLNLIFSARSRVLAGLHEKNVSAAYLSGVLIGAEVKAAMHLYGEGKKIHLIGADHLVDSYATAIQIYQGKSVKYQGALMAAQGAMLLANRFFMNHSLERRA